MLVNSLLGNSVETNSSILDIPSVMELDENA